MLNLKHLYYFMTVVREGGVTRAADRLHLTPQTLSGQISRLETQVGTLLFDRSGRRMELTSAGKLALPYAEEIFQTATELEELLRSGGEERFVRFRVGISDVVPKFVAHRLLAPVLAKPEMIRLVCQEGPFEQLLADMAIHRLDMVLTDRPMSREIDVRGHSHLLGESGVSFLAASTLARKLQGPFPGNLQGQPLLLPGKDSALHHVLPRWLERQGIHMRIIGEIDDSALMQAFGEGGAGIFIAATASLSDVMSHHEVEQIGMTEEIRERFFLISPERLLQHPAARMVSEHARNTLFGRQLARSGTRRGKEQEGAVSG